jgi:hypothetical protein
MGGRRKHRLDIATYLAVCMPRALFAILIESGGKQSRRIAIAGGREDDGRTERRN